MSVKILWFHLRNSKGVVDIEWEPEQNGLTTIGGKSGQGKTAVLDNLAWLFGGDRYKPEKAQREGSGKYPDLDATLSNGLRVTRKGKRSSLKVVDPSNRLGNQSLLREFVGTFALDTSKFLRLNGKDKAAILLNIIGVGDELKRLDKLHEELYSEREAHGRVTVQKEKYAAELPLHKDVPAEETSAVALIEEIRKVDAANAENAAQRRKLESLDRCLGDDKDIIADMTERMGEDRNQQQLHIASLERQLADAQATLVTMTEEHQQKIAAKTDSMLFHQEKCVERKAYVEKLIDQPTDALQQQLADCEEVNARVRANAEKKAATAEGGRLRGEYAELTGKVEDTRAARIALLDNADLPLPGLGIESGELTYDGMPWDSMSTSDQMKVAAAIASRENPNCGFILPDGLETMDVETLAEFGGWAVEHNLQVIGTRVSVGDECSLIVHEGTVKTEETETDDE